uniref:Uncharacterized protein n=1 Tax=Pseudomonas phage Cygsa01 TaxID=3138529 RepID=A0AAU6W432_9VIRU
MKSLVSLAVALVLVNLLTLAQAPLNYTLRYPSWNPGGAHYMVRRRHPWGV